RRRNSGERCRAPKLKCDTHSEGQDPPWHEGLPRVCPRSSQRSRGNLDRGQGHIPYRDPGDSSFVEQPTNPGTRKPKHRPPDECSSHGHPIAGTASKKRSNTAAIPATGSQSKPNVERSKSGTSWLRCRDSQQKDQ